MESLDNLCLNCMKDKRDATECPFCGHKNSEKNDEGRLKAGSMLAERYLIGKNIHENGEGITYIAFDAKKSKVVEIREFFPMNLAERNEDGSGVDALEDSKIIFKDYLADFVENARSLSRLKELPSIIKIFDILELNHTAYVVCEHFKESVTPHKAITHNPKGRISWEEAKSLMNPVIRCVAAAHSIGLMHFGISPKTIILTGDGELKLTGFGIPEAYICETEIIPSLEEGYAAIEQYSLEGKKGKWTDVYAISAVLFFMLTGIEIPDAVKRSYDPGLNISKDLASSLPTHVLTALAHGLQVQPDSRTRSVEKFGEEIFGEKTESLRPSSEAVTVSKTEPAKAKSFSGNVARHTAAPAKAQKLIDAEQKVKAENKKKMQTTAITVAVTGAALLLVIVIAIAVLSPKGGDDGVSSNTSAVSSAISESSETPINSIDFSSLTSTGDLLHYDMPNFIGKTLEYAQKTAGEDFNVLIEKKEFSDEYGEGYIISQNVDSGAKIYAGTTVSVVVSKGTEYRKVPKIVGKDVATATKLLNDEGFKIGNITYEESSSVKKDRIIAIKGCAEGDKVKYGTAIDIIVSSGKNTEE